MAIQIHDICRLLMHQIITRRLGDTIHACAVMSALQRQGMANGFQVYDVFAPLFDQVSMPVRPSSIGSGWTVLSRGGFSGPLHGEHVRDTMYRAAGGKGAMAPLRLVASPGSPLPRSYVAICPGAGVAYKKWPKERWAPLIEHIHALGLDAVVCDLPGREPVRAPARTYFADVQIGALASIIAHARCLVSPDSGQVHLADALGTPVIGLYAATSTVTFGPYRDSSCCVDKHREVYPDGLNYDSSRHFKDKVMQSIGVGDVLEKLRMILTSSAH